MVNMPTDPARNGQPETYKIFEGWVNPNKSAAAEAPKFRTFTPEKFGQAELPKYSVYDVDFYSAALGRPAEEVQQYIDAGVTGNLNAEADAKIAVAGQNLVEDAVAVQASLEEIKDIGEELRARSSLKRFISPGHIAMLTSGDPLVRNNAVRHFEVVFAFEDLINKRMQSAKDDAGFMTDGDFADQMLTATIGVFSNELYQERERLVKQTEDLIYNPTLTLAQKEEEFDNILQRAADQGFFTDVNRYYLADFIEIAYAGRESSEAKWQEFWGKFDVAAAVIPVAGIGAFRGAKTIGSITSAYRTSGLRGTTALSSAGVIANTLVRAGAATTYRIATSPIRALGWGTNSPIPVAQYIARNLPIAERQGQILAEMFPGINTPETIRAANMSHTTNSGMFLYEQDNEVWQITKTMLEERGLALSDENIALLEDSLKARSTALHNSTGSRRFIDGNVKPDGLGNMYYYEIMGTQKGGVFQGASGKVAAQNFADSLPREAHVVEWERPNQWVVVDVRNVPTEMRGAKMEDLVAWAATPVEELGEGFFAKWLRNPAGQTSAANRASLLRAESTVDKWTKAFNTLMDDALKPLSKTESGEVAAVFNEYNYGEWVSRNESPTLAGFKDDFRFLHGKNPTEGQVFLYARAESLRNAESILIADEAFKLRVGNGVVVLDNQYQVIPVRAGDLPAGQKVYDTQAGLVDAGTLAPDVTVYKNAIAEQKIFNEVVDYVSGTDLKTRRLYHSDIAPSKPGLARIYREGEFNWYIKQETTYKTLTGDERKGLPRTVGGAKTIKEANDFRDELNRIIDYFAARFGRTDFTNADVASLRGDAAADMAVATNSKWNPTRVHSVDTLLDWADEMNVNLATKFDHVEHGKQLIPQDIEGFSNMRFETSLNVTSMDPKARRPKLLQKYGGNDGRTLDPFKATQKRGAEAIANQSYRQYMARAVNGLMKAGIENRAITNLGDLHNKSMAEKLREVKFRDTTAPGVGQKLELERQRILSHMDRRGFGDTQWAGMMDSLGNYLYGKGYKRVADFAADIRSNNPLTALRSFAFNAKLGLFTPSQLYVQASQTLNIVSVSPVHGLKGSAMYVPVRWALANGTPQFTKALGDLLGPVVGLTSDQFVDMVSLFRASGRDMVGVSLAEFGDEAATATNFLGPVVNKTLEKSRFFFNEGELVARISAWNTAYMEYLAKFPGRSTAKSHAKDWIMNRQDTLTQSMSGQSRTSFEKWPTMQFMSYQWRINEAIFAGTKSLGLKGKSELTSAEKFRLAVGHTLFFGASAWGVAATAMDWINYRYGIDMDEDTYRFIRKGTMDFLMEKVNGGVGTSLSSRLGSGDTLFQLMRDMSEKNFVALFGGPSVEVGWEALTVTLGGAKNLAKGVTTGDFEDFNESLVRFGRTFSTGNAAYNAYIAAKTGQYISRNNTLIADELVDLEPFFLALGVPLERVEEAFKFGNMQTIEKLFQKTTVKQIQREMNKANAELSRGDYEAYSETMRQVALIYHSMDVYEQLLIEKQVFDNYGTIEDRSILKAMQNDLGRGIDRSND